MYCVFAAVAWLDVDCGEFGVSCSVDSIWDDDCVDDDSCDAGVEYDSVCGPDLLGVVVDSGGFACVASVADVDLFGADCFCCLAASFVGGSVDGAF